MSKMESAVQPQLPAVPSDITPEWLGSKLGHKIKSIEHRGTGAIWGTGSKLFYTITYEDDENDDNHPAGTCSTLPSRPTHICIKGVFDPDMISAQPWTISLAQREADFFSKLAASLAKEKTTTIIFPKGWWAGTDSQQ